MKDRGVDMEVLDVSNNSFEREGADTLAAYLKSGASKLKELRMQMNEMGDLGCSAIAKSLKVIVLQAFSFSIPTPTDL